MTAKGKPKNYLSNENLLIEIRISKKKLEDGKGAKLPSECLTNRLVDMLMMLVDRYAQRYNFRGYSYIEDMKGEALLSLCQNALKFNLEKSANPFAYYTTIIYRAFISYMFKEKKLRAIRDSMLEELGFDPSFARQLENDNFGKDEIADKLQEALAVKEKEILPLVEKTPEPIITKPIEVIDVSIEPKKRGRKKGSKNKPNPVKEVTKNKDKEKTKVKQIVKSKRGRKPKKK